LPKRKGVEKKHSLLLINAGAQTDEEVYKERRRKNT
jgi:hypothetical protein